jgi:excisionase family DNA binding protein
MANRSTSGPRGVGPGQLLLTIEDAASCLAISRAHAYRLVQRGELPTIRLGRSRRVSRAALEAYVERLAREQEGGAA